MAASFGESRVGDSLFFSRRMELANRGMRLGLVGLSYGVAVALPGFDEEEFLDGVDVTAELSSCSDVEVAFSVTTGWYAGLVRPREAGLASGLGRPIAFGLAGPRIIDLSVASFQRWLASVLFLRRLGPLGVCYRQLAGPALRVHPCCGYV